MNRLAAVTRRLWFGLNPELRKSRFHAIRKDNPQVYEAQLGHPGMTLVVPETKAP
jgi:hypothetical protein